MTDTDPEECYQRFICDISTGNDENFQMAPILNIFETGAEEVLPCEFDDYFAQLKTARQFGEIGGSVQLCEKTYACPISGREMDVMAMEMARLHEEQVNEV